jgi:hypothetical protein
VREGDVAAGLDGEVPQFVRVVPEVREDAGPVLQLGVRADVLERWLHVEGDDVRRVDPA